MSPVAKKSTKKTTIKSTVKKTAKQTTAKTVAANRTNGRKTATKRVKYVPDEHEIQHRAFEIFVERGAEAGHEMKDWLQAETELTR